MADIGFDYAKDTIELIAKEIIKTTEELIDAYNEVSSDADNLKDKLVNVKNLTLNIMSCEGMPGDIILYKLRLKFEESKKAILDFQAKENKIKNSKSVIKKSAYKVKRFFIYAPEFKTKFKDLNDTLDALPNELKRIRELSKVLYEPNSLAYRNQFINEECAKFWIVIAGTEIGSGQDRWACFQKKYMQDYPDSKKWIPNDWDCIRSVACVDGSELTVFGFIELTNNAGFPINIDKVPSILDSNHSITESSRIEVGKMINELIVKFSSEEINNHILNVIKWYNSFDRDQFKDPNNIVPKKKENETEKEKKLREELEDAEKKRVYQLKANVCYKIIKRIRDENKPCDQWTDMEKLAQDVDKARRMISFFYQQFSVICEFGRLSKNILVNVDFPGKSRIKSFIDFYKPLDYANYHFIIKNGEAVETSEWIKRQPKVYNFLERFLETSESIEERNKEMKTKIIELNSKEKRLTEWEKKLEEREEKLAKNEKIYAEKAADLKTKEIINRFQKSALLTKKKEGKEPKTTKDKVKEGAQKVSDSLDLSKKKNIVKNDISKKNDDRKSSISIQMEP